MVVKLNCQLCVKQNANILCLEKNICTNEGKQHKKNQKRVSTETVYDRTIMSRVCAFEATKSRHCAKHHELWRNFFSLKQFIFTVYC